MGKSIEKLYAQLRSVSEGSFLRNIPAAVAEGPTKLLAYIVSGIEHGFTEIMV